MTSLNAAIRILIIEDDPQIRCFLRTSLSVRGFHIIETATGEKGLQAINQNKADLVILDLGLPHMDGISVITEIRKQSNLPIIVLSARSMESDKICALDAGADDYLTKPFGIGELFARLNVALRHSAQLNGDSNNTVFNVGELKLDVSTRLVYRGDKLIHLTPIEYKLFVVLMRHAGKVLTHKQLLLLVWGSSYSEQSHYVRIYMGQLRQKIESDPTHPQYLLTEVGVGYRLACL
jgi:two-component system KDP operon response regulator KdpE